MDSQLQTIQSEIVPSETSETALVLTPDEKNKIEYYKSSIDLNNKSGVIQYGASAQSRMVAFSETVLTQVRGKDLGAVGETLSGLVTNLKTFDQSINKPGGFFGFLKSLKKKVLFIQSQYSKIETNVVQVERQLEKHYQTLLKDIHLFDKLFEQNEQYYQEITLYIYAGEEKLKEIEQTVLPALKAEIQEKNDLKLEQKYKDLEQQLNRFDKKIHDLKLSRVISLQLAPQIRLVQTNSSMLMDKVHSSIVNTLPLWRNQMVLALGLVHSQQALEAQKAVNDATNKMLSKNSDLLRNSSLKIAEENERGIVDIETLRKVNIDLFATINDIVRIQEDGRRKRHSAENELQNIENELRAKLIGNS